MLTNSAVARPVPLPGPQVGQTADMTAEAADTFREKQRVVAAHDLDGVPAGTPGTVVSVTGLTWTRYRVTFDNGVERNLLDGSHLAPSPGKG